MGLREALKTMDLERARSLLRVENVWCDTRTEQNSQNFVLWAGYILEQR